MFSVLLNVVLDQQDACLMAPGAVNTVIGTPLGVSRPPLSMLVIKQQNLLALKSPSAPR